MLKKIIFITLIATLNLYSQNLLGVKIYINPGHGGHDSNDRHIVATDFWESEGNLAKGLYLRDILESFNAITKMSRTTNTSDDDLGLSVIVADANNFDPDYFHSIHSNAYNGKSNYTLLLFQGKDNAPTYPDSKVMGALLANEIMKAHRTTAKYNRGDADFYGTGQPYLGVFKGLNVPGTLSEGSFHDYIPESWRLKNEGYLKHEAWAITKAFLEYFGQQDLPYGEIAGIVRDPFQLVNYYYIPGGKDNNKPINLLKATLLPTNETYSGDYYNNGFFLFDELTPGDYQVVIETEGSRKDTISVSVEAGKTTFADTYYSDTNPRSELALLSSFPQNNSTEISSTVKIKIKLDAAIEFASLGGKVYFTDENNNSVSLKSFEETNYEEGWIIFEPSDSLENFANYKVVIKSGVKDTYGFELKNDIEINFRVEGITEVEGNTIYSFEDNDGWKQPEESTTTVGIDESKTSFLISNTKSVDGSNAARLVYRFDSDSNGVCRVYNENEISLGTDVNGSLGLWIFGDASRNTLEFWFNDSEGVNVPLFVDSLTWTGWKYKQIDLSGYSNLSFHSIVINQNSNGEIGGQLYFDKVLTNTTVTGINDAKLEVPSDYYLGQNYPNPFNPSTSIEYRIADASFVTINIYDPLGRIVKTLVNENQRAGKYTLNFDGTNLTSGIYFYTITANNFIKTNKMILMK